MKRKTIKLWAVILTLITILSLSSCSGCGTKNHEVPDPETSGPETTVAITPEETTPAETTAYETTLADITTAITPETSGVEITIPVATTPIVTSPVETEPAVTTPAEPTPAETTPSYPAPEETLAAETTFADVTLGETTPTEPVPEGTATVETVPVETEPTETTPAATESEETTSYELRDEIVYVFGTTVGLNLRSTDNFDDESNIVTTVPNETELKRIGYNELYSKVIYNDKEYFCSSAYITTELPASMITFEDVLEIVYVAPNGEWEGEVKLYTEPDRSKEATITISAKEAVLRTGIYLEDPENTEDNTGWSRIVIPSNGDIYYIRNSQISLVAPEE